MRMHVFEWWEILIFIAVTSSLTVALGKMWSQLVLDKHIFLQPCFGWLENMTYRFSGINPHEEMTWITYAKNLLCFNGIGFLFLFFILIFQGYLPLNPQNFEGISWLQAINIAISFVTNTNWQSYSGEEVLSYASQMVGLTVQNFLSAATGSAVLMAFIRGFIRKSSGTIGNFWKDLVRSLVYLLIPLSVILALILVSQGVIQTFSPYVTLEGLEKTEQMIPLGPAASQIAIKQIGSNGGGFFNANSAHPFENPTALSNFLEMVFLIALPSAMVYAYGILIGSKKHALIILGVMFTLWMLGLMIASVAEHQLNPVLDVYPVKEGMEVRFGRMNSLLWSLTTTATSNGSVNMALESLSPLAGGMALFNMMLGEVIFGGIGVGLCGMIIFVLLTVFLSGLMVGRSPEYMGKKLEKKDVQWMMLAILTPNILILLGTGISCILPIAQSSLSTFGPHGLTEMLYAFTSTATNNGSAFAGLKANTSYFNGCLAAVMLMGRLAIIIPSLAIAGSFASKKIVVQSAGTLSTNSFLFAFLLFSVILVIGGLTFLPAISLGPIVEHLLMINGEAYPMIERI